MLIEDIEVKVYRSRIKIPMIFFVPATFLATIYVLLYLYVNSTLFIQNVEDTLNANLPGSVALDELLVKPSFTDLSLYGGRVHDANGKLVIDAREVHASINPLLLLVGRLQVNEAIAIDSGVDMQIDEHTGEIDLMHVLGLDDLPETEDTGESLISKITLENLQTRDCYYRFSMGYFDFELPDIDLPGGAVDITDESLVMSVDALDVARIHFRFRHWLFGLGEEYGTWKFTAENVQIRNWSWANDGFSVERVHVEIAGNELDATGMMRFPPTEDGLDTRMVYRGEGILRAPFWSPLGHYFIQDMAHAEISSFRIAVEGDLEGIAGTTDFEVALLDAYGLSVSDVKGAASLRDEIVLIDYAEANLHEGLIEVPHAYYDMYTGRFGAEAHFVDVDPEGVVRDFGFDYPWLAGSASGSIVAVGQVPYEDPDDPGPQDSPWARVHDAVQPIVTVELTDDLVYTRRADEMLPGRHFVIARGATLWASEDRVGIPHAHITGESAEFEIADFIFDWEQYRLHPTFEDEPARLVVRTDRLEDFIGHYGGEGVDGRLEAKLRALGRINYPDLEFEARVTDPRFQVGDVAFDGETLELRGQLEKGRLDLARAVATTERGDAELSGWLDVLRDPSAILGDDGRPTTDFVSPRRHRAKLDFEVSKLDLKLIDAHVEPALELEGLGFASGTLSGMLEDPDARFAAHTRDASVLGQPISRFELDGSIVDKNITLDRLTLDAGAAGSFEASGFVGFDDTLGFELRGERIDLASIAPLRRNSPIAIRGEGDFYLEGKGTLDDPQIGGDARFRNLDVAGRHLGDLALVASTVDDTIHLVGALLPWMTVQLEVPLDDESSFYARFGIDHLNLVDALPELRQYRFLEETEATGTIEFFLDRDLTRYQVLANLEDVRVESMGKTFRNRGPLIVGVNDGELFQIQQATIGSDNRFVTIRGGIFLDQALIDLSLQGDLDLSLLNSFRASFPEFFPESFLEARGVLDIDASVRGTPGRLLADGYVAFAPTEILLRDLADPLYIASGTVRFGRDGISISRDHPLRGRILGGVYSATGSLGLEGLEPRDLRAQVWSHNMSYRIADVANLTFDTQLELRAPDLDRPDTWTVRGAVEILDGLYYENVSIFQEQFTNRLIGAFTRKTERYEASLVERFPALDEISFDVRLRARDGLRLQNEIDRLALDMELRVALRIQNTLTDPRVTGDVDVIDGRVTFQGQQFEVRSGALSFSGDANNPYVDIVAFADVDNTCRDPDISTDVSQTMNLSGVVEAGEQRSYHVILNVRGHLDNLDVQFDSNPYADQRDILSLLLTGCTVDQLTASSASSPTLEVALGPVLGWIEGQVQDVVEVEEFTITPSVDRLKATVGDSLTRRLTWRLQLDTGLTEAAAGQRFQLEYKLSDRWSAMASESSSESSRFEDRNFLVDFKLKYRLLLD